MGDIDKIESSQPTLYISKIINGKIYKKSLSLGDQECESLLAGNGYALLPNGEQYRKPKRSLSLECRHCGCTQDDFERTGRLGCALCYTTFEFFLEPLLQKMHSGSRHAGKIPAEHISPDLLRERVEQLVKDMDVAVGKEDYECAGRIRDEIRLLNVHLNGILSSSQA